MTAQIRLDEARAKGAAMRRVRVIPWNGAVDAFEGNFHAWAGLSERPFAIVELFSGKIHLCETRDIVEFLEPPDAPVVDASLVPTPPQEDSIVLASKAQRAHCIWLLERAIAQSGMALTTAECVTILQNAPLTQPVPHRSQPVWNDPADRVQPIPAASPTPEAGSPAEGRTRTRKRTPLELEEALYLGTDYAPTERWSWRFVESGGYDCMTDAVYVYDGDKHAFTLDGGNYGQKRCGDGSAAKLEMEQQAAWVVDSLNSAAARLRARPQQEGNR